MVMLMFLSVVVTATVSNMMTKEEEQDMRSSFG